MWIITYTAKEAPMFSSELYATADEARASFMEAYDEARAEDRVVDFWFSLDTASGHLETYSDDCYLSEAVAMGGLSGEGSSESEGVSGSAPLTGSRGASGSERPYGMREDCLLGVMEDLREVNQVLGDRIVGEPLSAGDAGQAYNLVRRALQVLPGVYDTGNGTPSIEELRVRARRVSR